MDGKATPTMETSSAFRNRATQKTTRMPQRRGFQRYSAEGAIVAVVMSSTLCMCKHYMQSNLIQLHLVLPRRYTSLMSPQQADPGLAEAGAVGAGAGLSGAVKAGAGEGRAPLARAVQRGPAGAGPARAGPAPAGREPGWPARLRRAPASPAAWPRW